MKWLSFIGLILAFTSIVEAAPKTKQVSKYTKAECILLTQQVDKYERRLGVYSRLYVDSKESLDTNCEKYKADLSKWANKQQTPEQ